MRRNPRGYYLKSRLLYARKAPGTKRFCAAFGMRLQVAGAGGAMTHLAANANFLFGAFFLPDSLSPHIAAWEVSSGSGSGCTVWRCSLARAAVIEARA